MTAGGASLRPMHAGGVLAGPAFTVKTRPGDNLMLHKAIDIAEPGDVIVVDGGGDLTNSLIGEMMSAHAEQRGIAGMVIYGSIRDYDTIHAGKFPVFAAGVTHRGPYKDGPGEINVPIAIDGMVIEPGDLIVGDGDGIVCVPFAQHRGSAEGHDREARGGNQAARGDQGRQERSRLGRRQPEEARRHYLKSREVRIMLNGMAMPGRRGIREARMWLLCAAGWNAGGDDRQPAASPRLSISRRQRRRGRSDRRGGRRPGDRLPRALHHRAEGPVRLAQAPDRRDRRSLADAKGRRA